MVQVGVWVLEYRNDNSNHTQAATVGVRIVDK